MKIVSPMPYGNGAHIVHKMLETDLPGYSVCSYNPYWTLFPPALFSLCPGRDADIIHTTPDYGFFFHKGRVPLVLTFHNFMLDNFMQSYSSLAQKIHYRTDLCWFTNRSLKMADVVTSVSRFTAELARKETGYSKEIRIIYNGIDAEKFSPRSEKKGGPVRVLFSGNLTRRKGMALLPKIAVRLNPGTIIQYTRGLGNKGEKFNLPNMQDIGSVKYSDMPKLYQQADMLLFPTVREGFSMATLEAMATGLPVIATDCSSLPEQIIHGKGGYLCKLGDVESFSSKINKLAESPKLRTEMGQFNREKVEQEFSLVTMIKNYRELFEEVLN